MRKLKVMILGAGNRGNRYATHMCEHPEKYEIVAMADPEKVRQEHFQKAYGVPAEGCYNTWQEALDQPKMADICVIATLDNMHYEPTLKAIELGYDLLLEKPVSITAQECAHIAKAARESGTKIAVGHVLRYTPFYNRIKDILMDGTIGDVVSVDAAERVGHKHFAHSYVRGRWANDRDSAPVILAKCSHDLDIIQWLLDKPCKKVHSFGSLTHFTAENAPVGAPVRCADGGCPVAETCPYNCLKEYLENQQCHRRSRISGGYSKNFEPTDDEIMETLRHEDFGLCVYHANNNVPDHQVVNMEFEGGVTARLTMNGFNAGGRYIRIYGTNGELSAYMRGEEIEVYTFHDKRHWTVPVLKDGESLNGNHGGGDAGLVEDLYDYLSGDYTGYRTADIQVSVRNHLMGFAAEESRLHDVVVDMDEYLEKYDM